MAFDYLKLRARIVEKDTSVAKIAEQMGISRQAFYERLNNNVPFKDYEIIELCNLLEIDPKLLDEYFFTEKVQ